MAQGEFEGQVAMKKTIPENSAQPLAWASLDSDPSHAFYMCEFHDLEDHTARLYRSAESDVPGSPPKLLDRGTLKQAHLNIEKPSPSVVVSILAKLHRNSISPTGKFGFPVPTYKGYAPMNNEWCNRWEDWFARQFRMDVQFEQSVRGPDPEMDRLLDTFVEKVVPRLLRPLQTRGRSIKPSLVHTDIWHGNIHRDRATQEPIVFDACCVYGHHESESSLKARYSLNKVGLTLWVVELGMFREQQYGWGPEYLQEYLDEIPPSEPREDFDDRNAIYAMCVFVANHYNRRVLTISIRRNYIVTAGLWEHRAYLREL